MESGGKIEQVYASLDEAWKLPLEGEDGTDSRHSKQSYLCQMTRGSHIYEMIRKNIYEMIRKK
jgi:hypothetical protein